MLLLVLLELSHPPPLPSFLSLSLSFPLSVEEIGQVESGVPEPEQSLTSCILFCNQLNYKDSALPAPPCQIVVPASQSALPALHKHFVLVCMISANPVLLSLQFQLLCSDPCLQYLSPQLCSAAPASGHPLVSRYQPSLNLRSACH